MGTSEIKPGLKTQIHVFGASRARADQLILNDTSSGPTATLIEHITDHIWRVYIHICCICAANKTRRRSYQGEGKASGHFKYPRLVPYSRFRRLVTA